MIGDKEHPILIDQWGCWQGPYNASEVKVGTQLYGKIKEHHRPDLTRDIGESGGELDVVTSLIEEVLDDGLIKTRNTYYRLGVKCATPDKE